MQLTFINSQAVQTMANEVCLNTLLPDEILEVFFDRVINQESLLLGDISSILFTCTRWKRVLENNPCISLAQTLFQLKKSPQSSIHPLREYIAPEHKKSFTSQELKLIDHGSSNGAKFEKLLMIQSPLFCPNSLFLSLLDRYSWNPQRCKTSANDNIRQVAEKQWSILNSLVWGTDDQRLMMIKNDFIAKLYAAGRDSIIWYRASHSVISTLKKFSNFKDKKIFIQVARCFGYSLFDESLKKDREVVLVAVQQDGGSLYYADESLKKDRDLVLAAVQQRGDTLYYADESLKKDREFVLAAVQKHGYALEYADESLKKDREIVLAAVQQSGLALQYADTSFKKDREINLAAVR